VALKLYRISQDANYGYDTFDSAVVVAENANAAARIHPSVYMNDVTRFGNWWEDGERYTWAFIDEINVEYLSDLPPDSKYKPGDVIVASFNAG
jgi:hypothetical protein